MRVTGGEELLSWTWWRLWEWYREGVDLRWPMRKTSTVEDWDWCVMVLVGTEERVIKLVVSGGRVVLWGWWVMRMKTDGCACRLIPEPKGVCYDSVGGWAMCVIRQMEFWKFIGAESRVRVEWSSGSFIPYSGQELRTWHIRLRTQGAPCDQLSALLAALLCLFSSYCWCLRMWRDEYLFVITFNVVQCCQCSSWRRKKVHSSLSSSFTRHLIINIWMRRKKICATDHKPLSNFTTQPWTFEELLAWQSLTPAGHRPYPRPRSPHHHHDHLPTHGYDRHWLIQSHSSNEVTPALVYSTIIRTLPWLGYVYGTISEHKCKRRWE